VVILFDLEDILGMLHSMEQKELEKKKKKN
jgi:hypothetical protein